MTEIVIFLLGVLTGIAIWERYDRANTINEIGKIKLKNADANQLDIFKPEQTGTGAGFVVKKPGLLKRLFKRKIKPVI